MLGHPAIAGHAEVAALRTEAATVIGAVGACAAGERRIDDHPLTHEVVGYVSADRGHTPDEVVPRDERVTGGPAAVCVEVGSTDSDSVDVDSDLGVAHERRWAFDDLDVAWRLQFDDPPTATYGPHPLIHVMPSRLTMPPRQAWALASSWASSASPSPLT